MSSDFFGVMLDMSRNAVMKPQQVKDFANLLSKMGYNMIQLYTEDTYEVENEPYFGYLRGRYTHDELKDIVSYCESIGVEVIPCVQTLAHLGPATFCWWEKIAPMNLLKIFLSRCENVLKRNTFTLVWTRLICLGLEDILTNTVLKIDLKF